MKNIFLFFVLVLFFVASSKAQDNPYSAFGYKAQQPSYDVTQRELFTIENTNASAEIQKYVLDTEGGRLYAIGKQGAIVEMKTIRPDEVLRFLSVDPITKNYPELTPYQFASNMPIWATDLDGLEARIYNDVSVPIGHTFLSVIDKNGVINVYTYGQYGEGKENSKQGPYGEGALVHLKGNAANEYIKHEFESYPDKIKVYELSDEITNKEKLIGYYSKIMKDGKPATSTHAVVTLANKNKETGSEAVRYKTYCGVPDGAVTENCSSVTLDALKEVTSSAIPYGLAPIPQDINAGLWRLSFFSDRYKNVTEDAKTKAENNSNGTKPK
jgi:hypothetical protein